MSYEIFPCLHGAFTSVAWLELLKTLAPVATACIAFVALRNWKRQDRAKREIEFVDSLVDAVHAYMTAMAGPLTRLGFEQIAIKSRAGGEGPEFALEGAIQYVVSHGEEAGIKLAKSLGEISPAVTLIRTRAAKGQVFNFKGYRDCYSAMMSMLHLYDAIEAAAVILQSKNLNWDNPEARLALERTLLGLDSNEMRLLIGKANVKVLDFAAKIYADTYA